MGCFTCAWCLFGFVAEADAKKACHWLRAAGFPQYAQLYEGKQDLLHSPPPPPWIMYVCLERNADPVDPDGCENPLS